MEENINEEAQDVETTTEEPTQEPNTTEGGLVEKEEEPKEEGFAPIPEGLDDEIFDAETRTLKEDKVVERLKQNQTDIERWKKQANDMRRKLSKGVDAPENIEDYAEQFVPNERYEFLVGDTETDVGKHINEVLSLLDKFAYSHGLSVETAKDLKNMYLGYTEDVKISDPRTEDEKAQDRASYIAEQKNKLGENAETIIRDNVKFFREYGIFSDEEKKELLYAMDKSATWNSIGMKIRKLFGQNTSTDIPVKSSLVSGLADDETLAKEYYDEKTSDARRMQILQSRIDAGRTGRLPMSY